MQTNSHEPIPRPQNRQIVACITLPLLLIIIAVAVVTSTLQLYNNAAALHAGEQRPEAR